MTDETDVKKMKGKNKLSRIISEKLGRVQVGCTTPQLCEGLSNEVQWSTTNINSLIYIISTSWNNSYIFLHHHNFPYDTDT